MASIHDQLCLRRRPGVALWGMVLFGISEVFTLHHQFGTTATSKVSYLVLTISFLSLAATFRCAIEKVVLLILSIVSAVALFAGVVGPGTFFAAKVVIMCGWFLAAAACGFWAFYSSRHAAGSS